jgi:hypothetical protein
VNILTALAENVKKEGDPRFDRTGHLPPDWGMRLLNHLAIGWIEGKEGFGRVKRRYSPTTPGSIRIGPSTRSR